MHNPVASGYLVTRELLPHHSLHHQCESYGCHHTVEQVGTVGVTSNRRLFGRTQQSEGQEAAMPEKVRKADFKQ